MLQYNINAMLRGIIDLIMRKIWKNLQKFTVFNMKIENTVKILTYYFSSSVS